MTAAEILIILTNALRLATTASGIIQSMTDENRTEPTDAEIEALKARQRKAESDWAAQLERLRNG